MSTRGLQAGLAVLTLAVLAGHAQAADLAARAPAVDAQAEVALPPAPAVMPAPDPIVPDLAAPRLEEGVAPDVLGLQAMRGTMERALLEPAAEVGVGAGVATEAGPAARAPAVARAAGAGALAGVAAMAVGRPLFLALLPLYSRLDRAALLEHPVRRDLVAAIRDRPGLNMSELQARFRLGWGGLQYHLQRLEAIGVVVSHRDGRERGYFLNDRAMVARAAGIQALKPPNARALAERVLAMPGATQEELALGLGLSRSVVSKYATKLTQASLLQREAGRNCLRLYPTDHLRELLHAAEPAPVRSAPSVVEAAA